MTVYVHKVSYDIADGNSYDDLYNYLDSLGDNYGKITKSSFIVATTLNSEAFCDELLAKMSKGDKVFVASLTKGTSSWRGLIDSNEKIKSILAKNTLK